MPYKSELQRKYFNKNRAMLERQGVDVDEWNASTKGKDLPEKAPMKKSAAAILYNVLVLNQRKHAAQQGFQDLLSPDQQANFQTADAAAAKAQAQRGAPSALQQARDRFNAPPVMGTWKGSTPTPSAAPAAAVPTPAAPATATPATATPAASSAKPAPMASSTT